MTITTTMAAGDFDGTSFPLSWRRSVPRSFSPSCWRVRPRRGCARASNPTQNFRRRRHFASVLSLTRPHVAKTLVYFRPSRTNIIRGDSIHFLPKRRRIVCRRWPHAIVVDGSKVAAFANGLSSCEVEIFLRHIRGRSWRDLEIVLF